MVLGSMGLLYLIAPKKCFGLSCMNGQFTLNVVSQSSVEKRKEQKQEISWFFGVADCSA
jgi:hypothetical protein